jgi:hypothetical protein
MCGASHSNRQYGKRGKRLMSDNAFRGELIIYQTADGLTKIEARLCDETVWLTLDQMSELFQRDKSTISRHIRNVFNEGELDRDSVVAKFATTAADGKTYQVDYYNLDVVISVGYRVKSLRGTQFRMWANIVLKEYIQKGFAMNDELLKNAGGGNYFDELLSRIRDIRSSEKVFYRKVLDIYALSIDYNPKVEASRLFFQAVQNKMHYAVHGNTAAEVIFARANGEMPFAGLTTWSGVMPRVGDALVAKNYLTEDEIDTLNRIVTLYLDFAELQAKDHIPMYMSDWLERLDDFLKISRKDILPHNGKIATEVAERKARSEFAKYKDRTAQELSPVELDYLRYLEQTQKQIEGKKRGKSRLE